MVYVFGAMLTDIIIFDSVNLEISQVMKTDGRAKNLVKILTRGKAGKSVPLMLQEEDYFYTQPVVRDENIIMLGDDHIHVVNLVENMTTIKSWTFFNEEGEEEVYVPSKWKPSWKMLPSIPGLNNK